MPGYETAVWVVVRLGEVVAESGLSAKIHVAKEELADEICRNSARLGLFIGFNCSKGTVIKEPDGERAKM